MFPCYWYFQIWKIIKKRKKDEGASDKWYAGIQIAVVYTFLGAAHSGPY